MDILDWYIKNRPIYKRLTLKVESLLSEVFEMQNISYHIISSRTKDIDSVNGKISKGKYDKPHEQIQDFSGIRIITYVEDEIEQICKIIEKIFNIDEDNSSNKSDDLGIDKVGYKSVHYIAYLDDSRLKLPEYEQYKGKCFEIQVRTILQHAWAEIEHDRNYKYTGKLPSDIGRRFKILAGVLEMADREFNNISNEIDLISDNTVKGTKKGELDIPISSTTITKYFETRFSKLIKNGYPIIQNTDEEIFIEIEKFGLKTLADLDKLISKKLEDSLNVYVKQNSLNELGLIRRILIISDFNKYFSEIVNEREEPWFWSISEHYDLEYNFFKQCGIDWNIIEEKYNAFLSEE